MPHWEPIKLNNLDKIRMKRCGVLNKYIFEKVKGLTALKEKSLENVEDGRMDDGRTTDTFRYYELTYEPSVQVSNLRCLSILALFNSFSNY